MESEGSLNLMDWFAQALVRWRWVVLAVWAAAGAVAAVRAPATPGLLNIRGGSERETEASLTEDLLNARFSRPIGEFYAVTLEAPGSFETPGPRAALDTLLAALSRQPYIGGVMVWNLNYQIAVPQTDEKWGFAVLHADWSARPAFQALASMPKT